MAPACSFQHLAPSPWPHTAAPCLRSHSRARSSRRSAPLAPLAPLAALALLTVQKLPALFTSVRAPADRLRDHRPVRHRLQGGQRHPRLSACRLPSCSQQVCAGWLPDHHCREDLCSMQGARLLPAQRTLSEVCCPAPVSSGPGPATACRSCLRWPSRPCPGRRSARAASRPHCKRSAAAAAAHKHSQSNCGTTLTCRSLMAREARVSIPRRRPEQAAVLLFWRH